jgi:amidase
VHGDDRRADREAVQARRQEAAQGRARLGQARPEGEQAGDRDAEAARESRRAAEGERVAEGTLHRHAQRRRQRDHRHAARPHADRAEAEALSADPTFTDRTQVGAAGTTVAVKDLIDVAGFLTTAGCRAIERGGSPAAADAACLAGLRAAIEAGEARVVGRTNLDELAIGASGVNQWFGTPRNPLDPGRIPGGSSSGSAVAVAVGEAEVGIGTDTGGSVRIPAACCGVVGLKTTIGRIPTAGVVPTSQSLDTVGPLGRDLAAVVRGMELLEPGFAPGTPALVVGRVRVPAVDPLIDAAIDRALARSELEVVEVSLPGWAEAFEAAVRIGVSEAYRNHGAMVEREPELVGELTRKAVLLGRETAVHEAGARRLQRRWAAELDRAFGQAELLVWPTLAAFPPPLEDAEAINRASRTIEVNLAGLPALSQPVPSAGPLPAGLQLVGPPGGEEQLVATGALIEFAVAD